MSEKTTRTVTIGNIAEVDGVLYAFELDGMGYINSMTAAKQAMELADEKVLNAALSKQVEELIAENAILRAQLEDDDDDR